jgi:hypothetical protein
MMGDTIIIFFTGNRLDSSISDGKAIALYYIIDSSGVSGAYQSMGDRIKIESEDNKVKRVKGYYSTDDTYYPYSMIRGNETQYNLSRFKIVQGRPCREDYRKFKLFEKQPLEKRLSVKTVEPEKQETPKKQELLEKRKQQIK